MEQDTEKEHYNPDYGPIDSSKLESFESDLPVHGTTDQLSCAFETDHSWSAEGKFPVEGTVEVEYEVDGVQIAPEAFREYARTFRTARIAPATAVELVHDDVTDALGMDGVFVRIDAEILDSKTYGVQGHTGTIETWKGGIRQ